MAIHHLGLVLTGGTIGSTATSASGEVKLQSHSEALPAWLSAEFSAIGPHRVTVKVPLRFHSEQARPKDWQTIAQSVKDLAQKGADAVLVLHGTDTMAYTSAALAYSLADLQIPVVLTGSNLPPDNPHSDARNNVSAALSAANSLDRGVYLVFAGSCDGPADVHLGTRAIKLQASGKSFYSPNGGPVATVQNGKLQQLRSWSPPSVPRFLEDRLGVDNSLINTFSGPVLQLDTYPGLSYKAMRSAIAAENIQGVVVQLYPCATAPTGSDGFGLDKFARFMVARGGHVIGTVAVSPEDVDAYYPSLPVITGSGISFQPGTLTSAATVKLMWAIDLCAGDSELVKRVMRYSIAGEITQDLR